MNCAGQSRRGLIASAMGMILPTAVHGEFEVKLTGTEPAGGPLRQRPGRPRAGRSRSPMSNVAQRK